MTGSVTQERIYLVQTLFAPLMFSSNDAFRVGITVAENYISLCHFWPQKNIDSVGNVLKHDICYLCFQESDFFIFFLLFWGGGCTSQKYYLALHLTRAPLKLKSAVQAGDPHRPAFDACRLRRPWCVQLSEAPLLCPAIYREWRCI